MILTFTPNPSLDLLFDAERLVWDDANRLPAPRVRMGGQGINLTRAARALGGSSMAAALLGGRVGEELERMLAAEGTPYHRIPIDGETRTFVGVRETETGRSLLLNPRGPDLTPAASDSILQQLTRVIDAVRPEWVAVCGSIPPGLPRELYAALGQHARKAGLKFVVDCDGSALRAAAPYATLLVPNQHEAERLLNLRITGDASLRQALSGLLALGCETAAITLGSQGAAIATASQAFFCAAPEVKTGSAVGAGDAFLAALLLALSAQAPPAEALAGAVATGTAVLLSRGGQLVDRADVEAMRRRTTARPLGETNGA